MKGKQHAVIGATCGLVAAIALNKSRISHMELSNLKGVLLDSSNMLRPIIECMIGGVIGSLIVDIDSKTSIASRKVSTLAIISIALFILLRFSNLGIITGIIDDTLTMFNGDLFIILFGVLVLLGKLSPHRQFTHKFLGTLAFCFAAIMLFSYYIAIGFVLGYISHILADKTTPAGLKFFEFKLPLMDKRNKFKIHF